MLDYLREKKQTMKAIKDMSFEEFKQCACSLGLISVNGANSSKKEITEVAAANNKYYTVDEFGDEMLKTIFSIAKNNGAKTFEDYL